MTTLMTFVKNENLIKKNTIEFPQEIWSIIKSYLKPPSSGDAFIISYNLFLQEHLNYKQYQNYRTLNNDKNILKKNISGKEYLQQARLNLSYTYAKNKWDTCKNTYFNINFIQVGHLIAVQYYSKKNNINQHDINNSIPHIILNKIDIQGIIIKVTKTYLTISPLPKNKYIKEYTENPNYSVNITHKIDVLWICKNHINDIINFNFINEIHTFKLLPKIVSLNNNLGYDANVLSSQLYLNYIQNENTNYARLVKRLYKIISDFDDNLFAYRWKAIDSSGSRKAKIYLPSKFTLTTCVYNIYLHNLAVKYITSRHIRSDNFAWDIIISDTRN